MSETTTDAPPPRRHRRRRWIALGITLGLVVAALAGLPVYVFPASEKMAPADVAYVIGPPTEERIAVAEKLKAEGMVQRILISVPRTGGQSASQLSACARPEVTCATPDPMSTKGEVAMLTEFARIHPAEKVVVITFAPHVARTRFILDKCYDGEATTVAAPTRLDFVDWVYQYAYQTTAFIKAALTSCADRAD